MKRSTCCLMFAALCLASASGAQAATCRITLKSGGWASGPSDISTKPVETVSHESECVEKAREGLRETFTAASPWAMGQSYTVTPNQVDFRYQDGEVRIEGQVRSSR